MTQCPCGRVAVLVVRPTHLAGLCDWCAAVVCDDPGYDVCTPTEWDNEWDDCSSRRRAPDATSPSGCKQIAAAHRR